MPPPLPPPPPPDGVCWTGVCCTDDDCWVGVLELELLELLPLLGLVGVTLPVVEPLEPDAAVDAELLEVVLAEDRPVVVEFDDEFGFGLGLCLGFGGDFSAGTAELDATPVTATVCLPLTPVFGVSWDTAACVDDCFLVAAPIANAAPKATATSSAISAMRRRVTVRLSCCVAAAPSGETVSFDAAAPSILRPHL